MACSAAIGVGMIEVRVSHRAATVDEVDAALARLDDVPGAYFGCDSGIAGLHPLQASLVVDPVLVLEVFADGVVPQALRAEGQALLGDPSLAGFRLCAGRGAGCDPLAALRAFLAAFTPLSEVQLLGALRFEAHRLADRNGTADAAASPSLGSLFFSDRYWERDAQGRWSLVTLRWAAGTTQAIDRPPLRTGQALHPTADAAEPADDFPEGGYAQVVARALEHLKTRPLVSLTLSQSFRRRAAVSPAAAFANLRRVNPAPASFFLHVPASGERLFGASPDLQLVVAQGEVTALPVCGTVARGNGPVGEAESLRELLNEDVDAASLAVCSDALRNDLAPLCEPGSLQLTDRRRPMSLATVVHTVDRLRGRLRTGVDAWDAIVATAAPVMVTGTPRRHALQSIQALEASPRGWYGGLVVRVGADGSALVGTMLRAALLQGGVAEVRTGGDLLADSDPPREERESRHKALSLWRALGMAPGDAPGSAAATATSATQPGGHRLRLVALGDPFEAAVSDLLQGMGWTLETDTTASAVHVLTGHDQPACRRWLAARQAHGAVVALGDAAAVVLADAGFAIEAVAPEQGRLLQCQPTAVAPWAGTGVFHVGRYARLALADTTLADGWTAWAHDTQGRAVALAHPASRTVCLLWRPDSLLCDAQARRALQAALALAGAPLTAPSGG